MKIFVVEFDDMKKDAVYWVIAATAVTSFLFGAGTAAEFVCGHSRRILFTDNGHL